MSDARAIGIASPGLFRSDGSYRWRPTCRSSAARISSAAWPGRDRPARPPSTTTPTSADWPSGPSSAPTSCTGSSAAAGAGRGSTSRARSAFPPSIGTATTANSTTPTSRATRFPLDKLTLKALFYQYGASFDRFEQIAAEDLGLPDGKLTGPAGDPDSIRAEVILSGPGRCRLFRAVVGDDDFYERFLDIHETAQMTDPSIAGKLISKLSNMRVEPAVNTDRLFGRMLAEAALIMYRQARRDGLPEGVPICLGGKPSYALPYFGPSTQRRLGAGGHDELSAALGDRRTRAERQPGRRRRPGRQDRPINGRATSLPALQENCKVAILDHIVGTVILSAGEESVGAQGLRRGPEILRCAQNDCPWDFAVLLAGACGNE